MTGIKISRIRQRIEGVFHEIQNTVHMAAKIASHTLRLFLRRQLQIDVLTFRALPSQ